MALCSFCKIRPSFSNQRQCLECHAAYMREWRKTHALSPEQRQHDSARSQVSVYIKRGLMVKPACCTKCGSRKRIEAHHPDYNKPREVVWLCRKCHTTYHRLSSEALADFAQGFQISAPVSVKVRHETIARAA